MVTGYFPGEGARWFSTSMRDMLRRRQEAEHGRRRVVISAPHQSTGTALAALVLVWLGGVSGCERNVRLAGKKIRHATVRAVTHYGMTLDEDAPPEQTAFVLLRAIRDDFLAPDAVARARALDTQFDVVAADVIAARNPTSLTRDELVYHIVNHWTPTVSYYVNDFETDWEKAKSRFVRVGPIDAGRAEPGVQECQILMEARDPSGDPQAQVLLAIGLIQDGGLWRVTQVGFIADARALPDAVRRAGDSAEVSVSPGG
ncbi:MAG: hypothetical protein ACE5HE_04340 [Phycisphaerae bacterium]